MELTPITDALNRGVDYLFFKTVMGYVTCWGALGLLYVKLLRPLFSSMSEIVEEMKTESTADLELQVLSDKNGGEF